MNKERLLTELIELLTDCTEAELQALIDVVTQFSHEED